jgi:hypothetical protein
LWSTACSSCHQSNTQPLERGQKIQALFVQAEAELEKAKQTVEEARRIPLDVSDYEARLSDSLTYLVEARPASHNLMLEETEDLTRRSRSISLEVQSDIHEKLGVFRGRLIVLAFVWFYILISVAVLIKYRRELEKRKSAKTENG